MLQDVTIIQRKCRISLQERLMDNGKWRSLKGPFQNARVMHVQQLIVRLRIDSHNKDTNPRISSSKLRKEGITN